MEIVKKKLSRKATNQKQKKQPKFSINKLPQIAEGLSKANEKRPACLHCGLFKSCVEPFATPTVNDEWTGKLLLITPELGKEADSITKQAYTLAGFSECDVARITPLRCATNKKPKMAQIRACRPFLLKILEVLKPKYVLGLGPVALRALRNSSDANLTKARGKEIKL